MKTAIEKLQINLADAEETVKQYEEKGIPDAKVKGIVEGIKQSLNVLLAFRREELQRVIDVLREDRLNYTGPAYDSHMRHIEDLEKELEALTDV